MGRRIKRLYGNGIAPDIDGTAIMPALPGLAGYMDDIGNWYSDFLRDVKEKAKRIYKSKVVPALCGTLVVSMLLPAVVLGRDCKDTDMKRWYSDSFKKTKLRLSEEELNGMRRGLRPIDVLNRSIGGLGGEEFDFIPPGTGSGGGGSYGPPVESSPEGGYMKFWEEHPYWASFLHGLGIFGVIGIINSLKKDKKDEEKKPDPIPPTDPFKWRF